jgi:hypothetical protein
LFIPAVSHLEEEVLQPLDVVLDHAGSVLCDKPIHVPLELVLGELVAVLEEVKSMLSWTNRMAVSSTKLRAS